ncbi:MAG: ATP-binding protein, partial [Bdellovibrionales bacterium]|nr:ATP-binding protein [Bdellovibrionales bacterium]
ISKQTHARVLRSDVLRKTIYGTDAKDKSLEFGQDKYSSEATDHTYRALVQCAQSELIHSRSVIVDASFTAIDYRAVFFEFARKAKLPVALIWCELDRSTALTRLKARTELGTDVSDGRAELYDKQLDHTQLPTPDERIPLLEIDTSSSVSTLAEKALDFLCASVNQTS